MSVDELARESRLIVLEPGDLVVLECPADVTAEAAASVKDRLRERYPSVFADREILVLGGGMTISAIRPSSA